ncbi:hypothetical protein ACWV26_13605 [Rummeliibacillus sp. JY-2-4R]
MNKKKRNKKLEQLGYDDTIHSRLTARQKMAQNRTRNRLKVHPKPKWVRSFGLFIFILLLFGLVVSAITIFL